MEVVAPQMMLNIQSFRGGKVLIAPCSEVAGGLVDAIYGALGSVDHMGR